jgi:putative spermidine/putrescine transport system permease protein
MRINRASTIVLASISALVLAIVYLPLIVVALNSFNTSMNMQWPPPGFTFSWWQKAFGSAGLMAALSTSVVIAFCSAAIALVLGTLLALALSRYKFFGKESIGLIVILPIALPGIVTGLALNNAFRSVLGMQLSMATVIVAHATFCIVTVYNNVLARLSRTNRNLEDASADLGAGVATTFWRVTLPQIRTALIAGGLLAFALSFDEIIVTTFTAGPDVETLPIWILNNMFRPGKAPVVNVVAVTTVLISVVPLIIAQRLTRDQSTKP